MRISNKHNFNKEWVFFFFKNCHSEFFFTHSKFIFDLKIACHFRLNLPPGSDCSLISGLVVGFSWLKCFCVGCLSSWYSLAEFYGTTLVLLINIAFPVKISLSNLTWLLNFLGLKSYIYLSYSIINMCKGVRRTQFLTKPNEIMT